MVKAQSAVIAEVSLEPLRPEEAMGIIKAARDERLVDLRSAGLMVYGHESGKFHCSISTVQRVLARNNLQAPYIVPRRKSAGETGYPLIDE